MFFWQIPHEDLFLLSCGPCLIPSQFPARALPIPHFNQIPNYSSPATSSGTLTVVELSVLGALEISAALEDGAVRAPWVLCEGVTQAVYVGCGSAHVYMCHPPPTARRWWWTSLIVSAGSLFVVPRFTVVCVAATGVTAWSGSRGSRAPNTFAKFGEPRTWRQCALNIVGYVSDKKRKIERRFGKVPR